MVKFTSPLFAVALFNLVDRAASEGCIVPHSILPYSIETAEGPKQYRFLKDGHVFMSHLEEGWPSREAINAIRPHPQFDPDGWGTTLYLQPFFPGALIDHTEEITPSATEEGIEVFMKGKVSRENLGIQTTFGTWNSSMHFYFDTPSQTIGGVGKYHISLPEAPSATTGDLNLVKFASNYLLNVTLLSGGQGDTGDMTKAVITSPEFTFEWHPPVHPAFYPADKTSNDMEIYLDGILNNIDTRDRGLVIKTGCKPTMTLRMTCNEPMFFGAQYDLRWATYFEMDNIGVTPLLARPATEISCDLRFHSEAFLGMGCC
uniref:Uncharacterized protein n=1 Tax=Chromera velia CCMP2878 TaxID=1169474 RepID=A0A0G4I5Q5_9ALVE|mmetsp:Transcript_41004/g.80884  ORF Transcript_41004/g.80884 Transcript_41004/m.80884 type:complete len:316 (+) Transcript_41004:164-1111(+)|eukprot:Cvel_1864.t1-p1 / transcript=Cvel_1864.t1 / gene=Cvel_1864 / organism=Chromera_velia_CCMP2878 / gene_product=hypothetical protein / transcript_product=hypothetical protein / location=Cvel_scaffold69:51888-53200(+) / protein_length=315 / sequence_SO=supercontig / SO=protein_coding / is_pseudo=false